MDEILISVYGRIRLGKAGPGAVSHGAASLGKARINEGLNERRNGFYHSRFKKG